MIKPFLEAKDLSLTVTLKEFYEYTKKEAYFYAFDLNNYRTIEIKMFFEFIFRDYGIRSNFPIFIFRISFIG